MQLTQQKVAEVTRSRPVRAGYGKREYRRRFWVFALIATVCFFAFLLPVVSHQRSIFGFSPVVTLVVGLLTALGLYLFAVCYLRCPMCGEFVGSRLSDFGAGMQCLQCGERLIGPRAKE